MKEKIVLACVLSWGLAAEVAQADFAFGQPTNLGPTVNSPSWDFGPNLSPDGLSLYFGSDRPGGSGGYDLWVTKRTTVSDSWGQPANLGSTVNSVAWDSCPCISADGLSLYFESQRPGGSGDDDIWVTSRQTPDDNWGPPVNLGPPVNSSVWDSCPSISADGLSLYFCSYRGGGFGSCDLWVATRATVSDPWGQPVNLGPAVNTWTWEYHPDISADGLILFFFSNRPGGSGDDDLWATTRASTSDPWTEAVNLGPTINSSARDFAASPSSDGRTLYFTSGRPGGMGDLDLWQVSVDPVVDFNGDGKVDDFEVLTMTDHWGTDESMCDIGPMPWGDGIVEVQDLIVLAAYIGQPVSDPGLLAHWTFDETEGDMAGDSGGENDAVVIGGATWRPAGGAVGGALELDGVDAYVETLPILNPSDGPFSVLAWIKGGAPGQAIVSQANGVNWLMIDAWAGTLATELVPAARRTPVPSLVSEAVVTDDTWHRVGFVWDGSTRGLYVDDLLVAEDTQTSLAGANTGLYIGCGADQAPGTFWQGLIDDVRVYKRAVKP